MCKFAVKGLNFDADLQNRLLEFILSSITLSQGPHISLNLPPNGTKYTINAEPTA